jgi:hypothetical protein
MGRELTPRRIAGLSGLAAAIVFGAGNALWGFEQPKSGAPAGEVVEFYADNSSEIVAGGSISLVSVALFVLFASAIRAMVREVDRDDVLATTAFGGAVLAMAAGLGAETINMVGALRADGGDLTPDLARALFEISYVLGFNAAGVGIGLFLLATAAAALRSRALLPRWLALLAIAVGLAFLTPLSVFLLGPGVLALAVASALLLRPAKALAPDR